ncbi:MAG: PrgI family protein [Candidatus Paceibacterota bacterium]|jgi:hypothetical protein
MQFQLPQFIEHETGFLGPLTVRQTVIFAFGLGISFFLWLILGKNNFWVFVSLSVVVISSSLALGFGKVNGLNMTTVLNNFFVFSVRPKLYLWKRKEVTVYYERKPQAKPSKDPEESQLKVTKSSKTKELSKKIQFGS